MNRFRIVLSLAAVLLVFAVIQLTSSRADAASSSEIREQINAMEEQQAQLEDKIQSLESLLRDNLSSIEDTVSQKAYIDQQIFLLQDQILLTNEQIAAFNVLIADKQDELDAAQAAFDILHNTYKDRIRAMEEAGNLSYWSVLFRANSFSDLLDRLNLINEIADADKRRLRELQKAAEEVTELKQELLDEKILLEKSWLEQSNSQKLLDEKRLTADALLQRLLEQGEEYEKLLQESEARQEELMQEIVKKESEYDQAAYQEWLATYVSSTTNTQAPEASNPDSAVPSTKWLRPVPYYTLTSPFGMRFHPLLNIWRMHNGVDLACAGGTPIYASQGGIVSVASYQENGAGNYVQINHGNGYSSIYMHMNYYIVSTGDYVAAGQVIGYVGSTGLSEGNHLHFGISYNGTYVNPMEYIA